ncbi:hypothetical protein CVH10_05065 [Halomonas sp. ND22Bw]|uniref:tripartite tricarboxylate transporter TctB family protein n=1 Tax=Halomonas sp. ND22Bw TaxID=2054178 RepID=UPI000D0BA1B6|nr:hypothetical protein CVH10_05065 [Halomonas sp. ND22Bw]
MLKTKQELVFSGLLALCASIICYFSFQIGGMAVGAVSPGAFPSVLAALIAVLALGNALRCGRDIWRYKGIIADAGKDDEVGMSARGFFNVLAFAVVSIVYVISLVSLGFVMTTAVYLFVMSLATARAAGRDISLRSVVMALVVSVLSTGGLYLVFVELLNVRF